MAHAKKMAQTKWHEYNDTIKMAQKRHRQNGKCKKWH